VSVLGGTLLEAASGAFPEELNAKTHPPVIYTALIAARMTLPSHGPRGPKSWSAGFAASMILERFKGAPRIVEGGHDVHRGRARRTWARSG
jgi:hypothetical protein